MTPLIPRPGRPRRALAVPLGLALAATLAFLPQSSAAAPRHAPAPVSAAAGPALSYVVNVAPGRPPSDEVTRAIADADGTITASYEAIGVLVVHAADPGFADALRAVDGVDSAGATRTRPLADEAAAPAARPAARPGGVAGEGEPVPLDDSRIARLSARADDGQDPLESEQWDLAAIRADQAHATTLGSPDVTVAVIDTGVDDTHPDLAPNFDRDASVNCVSGTPDTTDGAWRPLTGESSHGTHVAGEIAAAKNGVGMTGVAPGVKVAGIKVATSDGYFYTEAVVCGFVWAAEHGADVTNSSFFTDPWNYVCQDDPDQLALVEALERATGYAQDEGAVNVAAAGNETNDLAADTITDPQSPNDGTPVTRVVDPSVCLDVPTQLPGVVTVSAIGARSIKSSYSTYGLGVVDITAPGGDSTSYQAPEPPATSGLILGTLPGGGWGYLAGTSMASPHVAGVAALIRSTHPDATPAEVKDLLYTGARPLACTDPYDYNGDGTADAVCQEPAPDAEPTGDTPVGNGFYGVGVADALNAVTR